MLHPNQFQVNEAWIAFKLNDVPVNTESDGDFNVHIRLIMGEARESFREHFGAGRRQ